MSLEPFNADGVRRSGAAFLELLKLRFDLSTRSATELFEEGGMQARVDGSWWHGVFKRGTGA